jgi:hypothetical protein
MQSCASAAHLLHEHRLEAVSMATISRLMHTMSHKDIDESFTLGGVDEALSVD